MSNRTDGEILENPPTMIEIAGGSYPFPEPGKRRCRGLLSAVMQILDDFPSLAKYADKDKEGDTDPEGIDENPIEENPIEGKSLTDLVKSGLIADGIEALGAVDAMLDFIYAAIPAAGKNRKHIDDNAGEEEIGDAFSMIGEVIQRPFESLEETSPT